MLAEVESRSILLGLCELLVGSLSRKRMSTLLQFCALAKSYADGTQIRVMQIILLCDFLRFVRNVGKYQLLLRFACASKFINYYIKNVVLFEDNSILPLPARFEASGVKSVWGEVSRESRKNR